MKNRFLTILLFALWTISFAFLSIVLARSFFELSATVDAFEQNAVSLTTLSRALRDTTRQTQAESEDLAFLQNILQYIPDTNSSLRVQKALMEEVQSLRRKMAHRLKRRLHILVDTKANILTLKEGATVLLKADCSVGRGGVFTDKKSGRRWEFVTPRGKFRVIDKLTNPVWTKPDWAFYEEGVVPPPPGDPSRRVQGELGAYLLNLGDGYLIHGTKNEELLGRPASHGCVRVGADNLKILYEKAPLGTEVFIF